MIWPLICYAVVIGFFIAVAFSVSLLWVKILCWVIVGAITVVVIAAFIISQTYGKMGRGGG